MRKQTNKTSTLQNTQWARLLEKLLFFAYLKFDRAVVCRVKCIEQVMGVHARICNTIKGHVRLLGEYNGTWEEESNTTRCITSMGEELCVNVFEGLLVYHTARTFLSRQKHSIKMSSACVHNRNVSLSVTITNAVINYSFWLFYYIGKCETFIWFSFKFLFFISVLFFTFLNCYCYCGKHSGLSKH